MVIFKSQAQDFRDESPLEQIRRVIEISRKRWGKSAAKTEKIIRDAVPKPETLSEIDEFLKKARSVTAYELARRFGVRMSVARKILKQKESEGVIVPYVRDGGLAVFTTPTEMESHEAARAIIPSDAIEEVASTTTESAVVTPSLETEFAESSAIGVEKPGKTTRRRRESGEKKERKDTRPEVVVEPLVPDKPSEPVVEEAPKKTAKKKAPAKKKAAEKKPKKKAPAKKKAAEEKPKKKTPAKKKAAEEKPKKKTPAKKKAAEEKPKKKTPAKKKAVEEKPKKKAPAKKKAAEEKPKKKAPSKKKPAEEKPKKKAAEKKPKKKPAKK